MGETIITAIRLSKHARTRLRELGYTLIDYASGDECREARAVIVSPAIPWETTRHLLECSRARLLALFGSGTENLDLVWLEEHGVCAWSHPDYIADAVAEHAIALALVMLRRIIEADAMVRSGGWKEMPVRSLLGESLIGLRVGILGMGRIGARIARLAWAHGAATPILYWSRRPKPELERVLPLRYASLEEVFAKSRLVFVALPLTSETRGLVGKKLLSLMDKGYLVNVARGPIVDEESLKWALREGKLEAAALDVYWEEPYKPSKDLLESGRLVLTPHIAGYTRKAMEDTMSWLVDELDRVIKGGKPKYPLTSSCKA
ncbi:MAG: 2-hydroxyacid dehydrogenase [Pyrodictiaceae archaeon]